MGIKILAGTRGGKGNGPMKSEEWRARAGLDVSGKSARGLAQSKALRAAEVVADFGGVWVIAKKVFSAPRKNHFFLHFLKIADKQPF